MDRVLLIIPIYNGEKYLHATCVQLEELARKMEGSLKIVFVNDGSTDDTEVMLKDYRGSLKNVLQVITLEKNHGKGYAIREAIRNYGSESEIICFTDVDLPYGVSSIIEVIQKCSQTDIVVGSRASAYEQKQYSGYRYIANRLFRLCIPKDIRNIKDTQCGLKCFKSPVAKDIFNSIRTFRWTFDLEIFAIAKIKQYQIQEIPVSIQQHTLNTKGGVSFIKDGWQIMNDLYRIRKNIKHRLYEK